MIALGPNKILVEDVSELPQCENADALYLDFETTSGDRKRAAFDVWHGHRIAGAAVTWDDCPIAYYVPVRHADARWNVPLENFQRWLRGTVSTARTWRNSNVKFDAHFAAADGAEFSGELHCLLNRAKMLDSDRGFGRGGYGLDALSSDWLEEDIDEHDQEVQAYLRGLKSKDYGDVPADIMGRYASQDVLTGRKLDQYELGQFDRIVAEQPSFRMIWDVETRLTPVLYDMERAGLRVDPRQLRVQELVILTELMRLQETLHGLTGHAMEPNNARDCMELLVNMWGLPVLSWTDAEFFPDGTIKKAPNPSFDREALGKYRHHPDVTSSETRVQTLELMLRYRKKHTLLTFFVQPYQMKHHDGWLHSNYNQLIRTGRMSAKDPNPQQLNDEAKALIWPDTFEDGFLETDGSQMEFRLIAHYCNDAAVLDAYRQDPDTDFHQWVADMCGIHRKPAKNVNFCLPGDELVAGPRGPVTMRDVVEAERPLVLSSDGVGVRYARVVNGWSEGIKSLLRVTMEDDATIKCTETHGFMPPGGGRINAEDLRPGAILLQSDLTTSPPRPTRVRSVEPAGQDECFQISVEGWHTYVTQQGLISHNCIGYGGGKKKVLHMLSTNMELVGELGSRVDALIADGRIEESRRAEAFEALCTTRANEVYRKYHDTLPGLKRVTDRAAWLVKNTGFVFNAMGRRRHLPERAAWRAFNSITQGLASDLIKAGMVRLAPRYCSWTRDRGITLRANVHDSVLWHGPAETMRDPTVAATLTTVMEASPVPLNVPIRFDSKWTRSAWSDTQRLDVDRSLA